MNTGYESTGGHAYNTSFQDSIIITPTLDTSAYSSGDRLGSIHVLTGACRLNSGRALLQSLKILDALAQSAAMKIMFFNALPTIASADNAAINISDAEMLKWIGTVNVTETYDTTSANSFVTKYPIGLGMKSLDGNNGTLWAIPVIQASATYAVNSLQFTYDFLQC